MVACRARAASPGNAPRVTGRSQQNDIKPHPNPECWAPDRRSAKPSHLAPKAYQHVALIKTITLVLSHVSVAPCTPSYWTQMSPNVKQWVGGIRVMHA